PGNSSAPRVEPVQEAHEISDIQHRWRRRAVAVGVRVASREAAKKARKVAHAQDRVDGGTIAVRVAGWAGKIGQEGHRVEIADGEEARAARVVEIASEEGRCKRTNVAPRGAIGDWRLKPPVPMIQQYLRAMERDIIDRDVGAPVAIEVGYGHGVVGGDL